MLRFIIAIILCVTLGTPCWIVERANAKAIKFSTIPMLTTFVALSALGGVVLIAYQVVTLW